MFFILALIAIVFILLQFLILPPLGFYLWTYLFLGLFILFVIVTILIYKLHRSGKYIYISLAIFLYIFIPIAVLFFNSGIFKADSYKNLLPEPQIKEFSKEIEPFDISKAPIVTRSVALQIADKNISKDGTLGSRAEIDNITLQNIHGELYWIAPLSHSGLFAWSNNKDQGTPYIMVNANNKESKLVDTKIIYQPGSFFSQDLHRALYAFNKTYQYDDLTFEIDDKGNPYWTASVMKNKFGFGAKYVHGTAIVNATTGKVKFYSVKNTPQWVDRIQPEYIAINNINYRGNYINGFSPFKNNNKFQATEGSGIVYNEGKCYYYTGITSKGSDESSLGFYLVDTRSLQATYYKNSGATETAAIQSAEGKVQHLEYTGAFPVLMNVENSPTYFIPLQDKNDLTKMYAMVNVEDYTIIATGDTARECKENYTKALFSENKLSNSKGKQVEMSGVITRIGSYNQEGNTFYTITLDSSDLIFITSPTTSNEIPISKEGDRVRIKYIDNLSPVVSISEFDNENINQRNINTP